MQVDKVPLKKMIEKTERVLEVLDLVIKKIKPARLKREKEIDYSLMAMDLVDYLVKRGLPFRQAHGLVGEIVGYADAKGVALNRLSLETMKKFCPLFQRT